MPLRRRLRRAAAAPAPAAPAVAAPAAEAAAPAARVAKGRARKRARRQAGAPAAAPPAEEPRAAAAPRAKRRRGLRPAAAQPPAAEDVSSDNDADEAEQGGGFDATFDDGLSADASDAAPEGLKPLWADDAAESAVERRAQNTVMRRARRMPVLQRSDGPDWADPVQAARRQQEGQRAAESDGSLTSGDEVSEEARIDDVFKQTGKLVHSTGRLAPGRIKFTWQVKANAAQYSQQAVTDVGYSPNGELIYTASPDHCLRLFQCDGRRSQLVQTVRFDDLPVRSARFMPCGTRVVCSGERTHYGVVDLASSKVQIIRNLGSVSLRNLSVMATGSGGGRLGPRGAVCFGSRDGAAHVVSGATHQVLFTVKGEGPCNAVCFDNRTDQLWTLGANKVYVWDLRSQRPLRIHEDEGASLATCLAISRDYYAVGSSHGIVNVYSRPAAWPGDPVATAPRPLKAIESLVTEASFARFNRDRDFGTQLLAIGSGKKADQIRLVHIPSMTVYRNFPFGQDLQKGRAGGESSHGNLTCCDFSPNSGFMVIGNELGHALTVRLRSYTEL
eukprot:TRINITY_DN31928_c0_g1_i1.p1 TRINITY_DN31928_c0_g1~~TRINITY_DN31928_c0_g1_i1.p1  ORF type:complete len:585 (+),score=138.25 TRINITY_DN31928_c0_g1_i1:82-1755(+)